MEMRAASTMLRVTGGSFIWAVWRSRGQVVRLVTGNIQSKCSCSTVVRHECIQSTFVVEIQSCTSQSECKMTDCMRMGSQLETRHKGKGFQGGPGYNKADRKETPLSLISWKSSFSALWSMPFIQNVNCTDEVPLCSRHATTATFHDISDISFAFPPGQRGESHMKHTAPTDRKKCQSLEHSG